eukprot:Selendium_serpulae@DN4367_c0_g1_i4.p1
MIVFTILLFIYGFADRSSLRTVVFDERPNITTPTTASNTPLTEHHHEIPSPLPSDNNDDDDHHHDDHHHHDHDDDEEFCSDTDECKTPVPGDPNYRRDRRARSKSIASIRMASSPPRRQSIRVSPAAQKPRLSRSKSKLRRTGGGSGTRTARRVN